MPIQKPVLAIDLGATYTKIGLVNAKSKILKMEEVKTPKTKGAIIKTTPIVLPWPKLLSVPEKTAIMLLALPWARALAAALLSIKKFITAKILPGKSATNLLIAAHALIWKIWSAPKN